MNKTIFLSGLIKASIGGLVGWIFYRHWVGLVITSVLVSGLLHKFIVSSKNLKSLNLSFRAFLSGVHTELLVGKSFRNAVKATQETLQFEHPLLVSALATLILEIDLCKSEIDAWENFAECLSLEACHQFVQTLKVTYQNGGQITSVIRHTIQLISDQIEVSLELDVVLSAKKMEFYLMMILPVLMVGFLSFSNDVYMSMLFTSLLGRLVMTFVLFALTIAFIIGSQIIKIEV